MVLISCYGIMVAVVVVVERGKEVEGMNDGRRRILGMMAVIVVMGVDRVCGDVIVHVSINGIGAVVMVGRKWLRQHW